jgi:hypothetical protein
MKYIGYIFLGIALFIVGFGSYLIFDDKSKEKKKKLSQLAEARKAKSEKAELRKLNDELESVSLVENDALNELSDIIVKNNASEKKTIES